MARVHRESILTDPVAVASRLFPLEMAIMVALAYCLKPIVGTPEQILGAVVRYLMVDYCGPWVCPAASETTAALLACVSVPE